MKINDKVNEVLSKGGISLMGHVVGGYPNQPVSIAAAKGICRVADFLEVQFPFSDPFADGPVIESACFKAIEGGFKTQDGFHIVRELSSSTNTAIIIMTYANIIYRYGVDLFISRAKDAGASAFIIPDLPLESDEGLLETAKGAGVGVIQIASPGANAERIKLLSEKSDGVLYVTARRGITGNTTDIGEETLEWVNFVEKNSTKPIALGFGIKHKEQVRQLRGKVPVVVAGSYFVEKISALSSNDNVEDVLASAAKDLIF